MSNESLTYRFIPVRLKDLDGEQGELLALSLFEEDRPPDRLTGLVDWRMDGLISRIRAMTLYPDLDNPHYEGLALGPFSAQEEEKLLFPAGKQLPCNMVLVVGLGQRRHFTSQKYRQAVTHLLETAASMKVAQLVLQLPGWQVAGLPARRACDIFITELFALQRKGRKVPMDICFVEDLEHQAEMDERIVEILQAQRRR